MRGVSALRSGVLGAAIGCALAALQAGCASKFEGPYPCADGFASCDSENACEVDLGSDADHCGACDHACGLGARCSNAKCGVVAQKLGAFEPGVQTSMAINATDVFWTDGEGITMASLEGGAARKVITDLQRCNGRADFAVDADHIYYFSNDSAEGLAAGGLAAREIATGTLNPLVPTPPTQANTGCGFIAVDAKSVYTLTTLQQSKVQADGSRADLALSRLPLAGGTAISLATLAGGQNPDSVGVLVLAANLVLSWVPPSNNSEPSLRSVPVTGGAPKTIPIDLNLRGGFDAFTADAKHLYVVGSGCDCGGDGDKKEGPPQGAVGKLNLDGSHGRVLASFSGLASAIAVDADHVYWSTEAAVWKVRNTGGDPVQIAGGLSGGAPAYKCDGTCNGGGQGRPSTRIAVDATSLYVSDPSVGAVLKMAK